jgi:hypothetical protein
VNVSSARPVQDKLRKDLAIVNSDLNGLLLRQESGLITMDQVNALKILKKNKSDIETRLSKMEGDRLRHLNFRTNQKRKLQELVDLNPSIAKVLKVHSKKGRPPIVDEQPGILTAILDLLSFGSSADDRRRIEGLRAVKSLDDLTAELQKQNFNISRTATYYHLMPRDSTSIDGKRHVNTVPVRLVRASNDKHSHHQDSMFARSSIEHLYELASLLGPHDVFVISQDDKCRIPLGITAAKCQAPLLMHMEYKVRLADHDWVVADRHKLIPSVYAGLQVESEGFGDPKAVSYSGMNRNDPELMYF